MAGQPVRVELRRFGVGQAPVVVIDGFSGNPERVCNIAEALAPFPAQHASFYPGVRRNIVPADADADHYVTESCQRAAQFIAGAFDIDSFELVEASFSMVTTLPSNLLPVQRAPHFDSTDPNHIALLHFLRVPEWSGTAFFRHRITEIEKVTEANVARFVAVAAAQAAGLRPGTGYIQGSDEHFEQIGLVEAVADRMLIYQGSLLHSGLIPPDMPFTSDPRAGRLTANIFIRGHGRK